MQFDNIKLGTVVKIWHHPKGHDYVVVGEDLDNKELLLIKNNCLNNDGTVHGSTTKFHKKLSYSDFTGVRSVSGISRILGQKDLSEFDFDHILPTGCRVIPEHKTFKTSAQSNNFSLLTY